MLRVNNLLLPIPPLLTDVFQKHTLNAKSAKSIALRRCLALDLEEILSSACRRKIIKYLSENGSTNIMRLILGIRGKYPQTNAELHILQKEGIVIDHRVGRMRIVKLNKENSNTVLLLQALKILHSAENKENFFT